AARPSATSPRSTGCGGAAATARVGAATAGTAGTVRRVRATLLRHARGTGLERRRVRRARELLGREPTVGDALLAVIDERLAPRRDLRGLRVATGTLRVLGVEFDVAIDGVLARRRSRSAAA